MHPGQQGQAVIDEAPCPLHRTHLDVGVDQRDQQAQLDRWIDRRPGTQLAQRRFGQLDGGGCLAGQEQAVGHLRGGLRRDGPGGRKRFGGLEGGQRRGEVVAVQQHVALHQAGEAGQVGQLVALRLGEHDGRPSRGLGDLARRKLAADQRHPGGQLFADAGRPPITQVIGVDAEPIGQVGQRLIGRHPVSRLDCGQEPAAVARLGQLALREPTLYPQVTNPCPQLFPFPVRSHARTLPAPTPHPADPPLIPVPVDHDVRNSDTPPKPALSS